MVGQAPFQAAHRLVVGPSRCNLGVVVRTSGAALHPDLGKRHDVQRQIELPVAAARQAMPGSFSASHLNRGDAGIVGKGRRSSESARVSGAAQQSTCDDRSNSVDLSQPAVGRGTLGI